MAPPEIKLVKLTVVENATQNNVTGDKNWAAIKKAATTATIEATTAPKNSPEEWRLIRWSGGEEVKGKPNRRTVSLALSRNHRVEAKLGEVTDFVSLWVLWAAVTILTKGTRPTNAAPFDPGTRDGTDKLGAVTYVSTTSSIIDEAKGEFVDNMGASGKVTPVATLSPLGVNAVVKAGWTFRREAWTHEWRDGVKGPGWNDNWTPDTSNPRYLRLTPDGEDKIYDLDAPDLRWGQASSDTYNNFRQWIEWNGEKCSDDAPWHWQARWRLDKDTKKQITLNDVGPKLMTLPSKSHFPVHKAR